MHLDIQFIVRIALSQDNLALQVIRTVATYSKPKALDMSSDSQLWFLLGEELSSQSFSQVKLTLEDIKRDGISLSSVAVMLSLRDPVDEYAFFIHSISMQAAVQMLSDRAIAATWQLYCQNDPIVTIVVRKAKDPSPNTSRAPSYSKALGERRTASGSLIVPDLPIHTPPRQVSSGIDSYTQQPLADLPETDKIVVVDDRGDAQALSKEYLICTSTNNASSSSCTSCISPLVELTLEVYDSMNSDRSRSLD